MRLVLISDTHLQHDFAIPEGDILVHAGDLTFRGDVHEMTRAASWLKGVRVGHGFKHAVVIGGNHDWMAEKDPAMARLLIEQAGCIYLDHQPEEVAGLKFFGSGYTPEFCGWALNVPRGPKLAALWSQIPDDTQVLVTHGPPKGRLDAVRDQDGDGYSTMWGAGPRWITRNVGCSDLRDRIVDLKDLLIHTYGHIHRDGIVKGADGVTYVNASICDESYRASHKPKVLDINGKIVSVVSQ